MKMEMRMRELLPFLILLAAVSPFSGCGQSESTRTRNAILRVIRADEELGSKRDSLPSNATPSQIAAEIVNYCSALERLDMSDCPADFRVAYRHHMTAWREVQGAVQQMPDGFVDGVFMGAINSLIRGEMDGGMGRMQGDLQRGLEKVQSTWFEVEKIGANYGAAL
jgi:hypothetical protein